MSTLPFDPLVFTLTLTGQELEATLDALTEAGGRARQQAALWKGRPREPRYLEEAAGFEGLARKLQGQRAAAAAGAPAPTLKSPLPVWIDELDPPLAGLAYSPLNKAHLRLVRDVAVTPDLELLRLHRFGPIALGMVRASIPARIDIVGAEELRRWRAETAALPTFAARTEALHERARRQAETPLGRPFQVAPRATTAPAS